MREMKDSGITYIGSIPSEWEIIPIKARYRFSTGFTPPSGQDEYYDPDGETWITIADMKDDITVNSEKHITKSYAEQKGKKVPKGSLLYSFKLSVGKTTMLGCSAYTNEAIAAFPSDENPCTEYLRYSSMFIEGNANENIYGAKILNQQLINNAPVPYPPMSEQYAIVKFLDTKCAAIDEAIERHKKTIEKLEKYQKAITFHYVTKGINTEELKISGTEWLGSIPKSWEVRRIVTLFAETNERGNENLPILTVSINSGISDRELEEGESERVFVRSEDKSKYKHVLPGDIAYNMMRAWQGAFGAARVEGMVSPAYVTARPVVEMDTRYFEYLMRTDVAAEEFKKYSRGITDFRLRLYWPEFKNIKVCVPPVDEQRKIADKIDQTYKKIDEAKIRINKIINMLQEYRKSLIYHAVTGKIDCRGADAS